jgi:hypothetical protein
LIAIAKAYDNNQWPLDWFITHDVVTIGFKQLMTTSTMAQTWALRTFCYNVSAFYFP